uniref:Acyl-CoA desaturase 1 n=1 Tax=Lygus hesperus TaxID=30085 RepID=A0A0A9WX91_LYGHE
MKWFTAAFVFHVMTGTTGITAGAHRLWSHRSYKAKWPARLILAICNTIANQASIMHWSIEHRVHHRYSDTDADPHNMSRGFFYSHMGWLFTPRSDAFIAARKEVDISDLKADTIVYYQDKYYGFLSIFFCFILPGLMGYYFANDYVRGLLYLGFLRWVITLHVTWCVNSVAHKYGTRPYDPYILPTEIAPVSFFSGGEGWHNYHHAFPWDYAASEIRSDLFWRFNLARFWIDCFAALGWVYDRKIQRNVHGVPISRPEMATTKPCEDFIRHIKSGSH